MKHISKVLIAIILTLGIAGAATAFGKHRFGNPEKRAEYMVSYISDELNLDTIQQQALSVFKDTLINSQSIVRSDMKDLRMQANSLFASDVFDRAMALDLINSRTARVNTLAPDLVNSLGDFLDSLDSEQKTRVSEFATKHALRHKRHRH